MSESEALAFVRQSLGDIKQDIRELTHKVEQSISDADSRFEALEACPCPRQALQAPAAAPTGFAGFLSNASWLPLVSKAAWPVAVIFALLWRDATPETRTQVQQVAADAAGVKLPKDSADAVSAASRAEWARFRAQQTGGPR